MHTINTHKNESKHSEMGPVRQNPIQVSEDDVNPAAVVSLMWTLNPHSHHCYSSLEPCCVADGFTHDTLGLRKKMVNVCASYNHSVIKLVCRYFSSLTSVPLDALTKVFRHLSFIYTASLDSLPPTAVHG